MKQPNRDKNAATDSPKPAPDLMEILAGLPKGKLPPVHLWHPERIGEIDIRIARDGTWYHEGAAIKRKRMVKLFSTVLRLDDDGRYYLVTPVEKLGIQVEDAPFSAVEMRVHGTGKDQVLTFRSNVDDQVMASRDHPIRLTVDVETGEPAPYVLIRDGLEALIVRSVFYDLVELAVEVAADEDTGGGEDSKSMLGIWSAGEFFFLGDATEVAG